MHVPSLARLEIKSIGRYIDQLLSHESYIVQINLLYWLFGCDVVP